MITYKSASGLAPKDERKIIIYFARAGNHAIKIGMSH